MYSTMHTANPSKPIPSRRGFLKGSAVAAGALVIGTHLNFGKARAATPQDPPMPNAFIKIEPDSTVTVMIAARARTAINPSQFIKDRRYKSPGHSGNYQRGT